MAGLPGGAAIPGGIPVLWAPAPSEVGQQPDTTTVLRAPTYVPRWAPRFNYWGKFTDYLTGTPPVINSGDGSAGGVGSATAVGEAVTAGTSQARAPTFTPTWQRWRVENLGWRDYLTVQIIPAEGLNYDWPNPRGARRSVDLLTWTQSARLIGAVISSADGTAQGVGSASGVSDAPAGATARAPVYTPRWQRRLIDWGWADHLTVQIIPPEGNQKSWPNPRGPHWPISLRTWLGVRVGTAVVSGDGNGSATGVGSASGVGASTVAQSGSASGVGTASAIGAVTFASPGTAQGVGHAMGISDPGTSTGSAGGVGTAAAVGEAVGGPTRDNDCLLEFEDVTSFLILEDGSGFLALEICDEVVVPPQPGGAGFVHTFSRKKWRELQMLIAAEMAAVAKAERVTTPAKRQALLKAAHAAAGAIDAAEAEGENKRLDALLVRNANLIRAAIRADNQSKLLRQAAAAIELSRTIVLRQAENEEDEMIMLLMMS